MRCCGDKRAASVVLLLAFAALLASLSCKKSGSDLWTVYGHVTIQYSNSQPVPSGSVTVDSYVYNTGEPWGDPRGHWEYSFTNGALDIPSQKYFLGYKEGTYTTTVCWVVTTWGGMSQYADTQYCHPFLRLEEPEDPVETLQFTIYEDLPPAGP